MNYYRRFMADYGSKTAALSLAEHGAYSLLLDIYYSTEKPLPESLEALYRLCRAMTKAEQMAVKSVAEQFFPVSGGVRRNERADEEIALAKPAIDAAKTNGVKGGRPKRNPPDNPVGNPTGNPVGYKEGTQDEPNGGHPPSSILQPLASSPQPPEEKQARSPSGSRLPSDWQPDDELLAWAKEKRPDLNLADSVLRFSNYWQAKPGKDGRKLDWRRTFQNWVLGERSQPGPKVHDYSGVRV